MLISIQYLRALAALLVVLVHAMPAFIRGRFGVDIFFVISGFIMVCTTTNDPTPVNFFRRRLWRIVPLYWIFTLIAAFIVAQPTISIGLAVEPQQLIKSLLFIPYRDAYNSIVPVLLPGWTLNYEMYFYVLFAVSLLLPRSVRVVSLSSVIALLSIVGMIFHPKNPVLGMWTSSLLLEFVFGMTIARAWMGGLKLSHAQACCSVIAGLFIFAFSTPDGPLRFLEWGASASFLVTGFIYLDSYLRQFPIAILQLLGDASYSIYVTHYLTIRGYSATVGKFLGTADAYHPLSLLFLFVLVVLVGIATYFVVEKPMLDWGRRQRARAFAA